jgi:hypothetical protein
VGVDHHQLALRQHQHVHGGVHACAFAAAQHLVDVVQVQLGGAEGAADHAVGVALLDHHGADQRVAAAHFQLGVLLRDALARGQLVVRFQ